MSVLKDKVAIVTGGAQGIGKGIATALAKEGAHLVIVDLRPDKISEAESEISSLGVRVHSVAGDVRLPESAESACEVAENEHGRLDILVNCAQGMVSGVPFQEHSDSDFDLAISTGLWGAFRFMRRSYPLLAAQGGAIVNVVSSAGTHGLPGFAGYAAAKEGIRGLTKVAANEWGPAGIRVNAICPQANTATSDAFMQQNPGRQSEKLARRPIKRDGDPETDIGRTVVFLVGPDSGFITGVTLMVNGGLTIMP
jgi:NAD(P)-dependent dehydrogenase (short-subunit alcohol dehydrogenase family)